jgi:hypothetical protein
MGFDGVWEIVFLTHKVRLKELLKLKQRHNMKFKVLLVLKTTNFHVFNSNYYL